MEENMNVDVTAQVVPNIDISEIDNDHMYLMFVALDCSGSMSRHTSEMIKAMDSFKDSIEGSKQDDEMLISMARFDEDIDVTGFQNVKDMDTSYQAGGMTRLYDTIIVGQERLMDYMDQLNSSGVRTRGTLVIFSDGDDTYSRRDEADAAEAIRKLREQEITVAFVGFGDDAKGIAQRLGVPPQDIMETAATASELRKIWGIMSKSAISASKSTAAGASQTSFFDV